MAEVFENIEDPCPQPQLNTSESSPTPKKEHTLSRYLFVVTGRRWRLGVSSALSHRRPHQQGRFELVRIMDNTVEFRLAVAHTDVSAGIHHWNKLALLDQLLRAYKKFLQLFSFPSFLLSRMVQWMNQIRHV